MPGTHSGVAGSYSLLIICRLMLKVGTYSSRLRTEGGCDAHNLLAPAGFQALSVSTRTAPERYRRGAGQPLTALGPLAAAAPAIAELGCSGTRVSPMDQTAGASRAWTWSSTTGYEARSASARGGRRSRPPASSTGSRCGLPARCTATRGYDGGKKVPGRKRHVTTDCIGLLLVVTVTAAHMATVRPRCPSYVPSFVRMNRDSCWCGGACCSALCCLSVWRPRGAWRYSWTRSDGWNCGDFGAVGVRSAEGVGWSWGKRASP
ncbi:hypothetical protein BX283_0296 [Streptomyces sp. TLI_146]|nr:hypothetical protein BX283_0296 [Streptomyces sp. TLI_146]